MFFPAEVILRICSLGSLAPNTSRVLVSSSFPKESRQSDAAKWSYETCSLDEPSVYTEEALFALKETSVLETLCVWLCPRSIYVGSTVEGL